MRGEMQVTRRSREAGQNLLGRVGSEDRLGAFARSLGQRFDRQDFFPRLVQCTKAPHFVSAIVDVTESQQAVRLGLALILARDEGAPRMQDTNRADGVVGP